MNHWDQPFPGDPGSFEGTWEKLSQVAVKGAEYDSRERQPHPKCLKGTRVDLLDYINGLLDSREKSRLIWLHGTAGVGKSAVAFTVAERMRSLKVTERTKNEMRLAGTFFFSRKHTKRSTTGYFFATLAYQLARNFPSVREEVNRAIREHPALLHPDTSLRDQMEALFRRPLWMLRFRLRDCPPSVFVVDALDECISASELADLIALLGQALQESELPIIHILLTSRSEKHIRKAIQTEEMRSLVCEIPVKTSGEGVSTIISLDGADVDNDICIFLEHSFRELGSSHPDFPQPPMDQLAQLASRAGRRFIVASTMMKFIDDGDHDPRDRLQLMLELSSELLPGTEVYRLYDCILSTCADPKRAYQHLSIVAALADPLPISQISKLLGPGLGMDVETALVQLRSVMDIPTDGSLPVNIFHSSVRDYVSDPSNCSLPQVQHVTSPHSVLAHSSLRLMMQDSSEHTNLLDALLALKMHSQAMQPHDPQNLKHSLSFIVQQLEPLQVLQCLLWLRGARSSDLQSWLETLDGHAWLQIEGGANWLQTLGGEDWLQTRAGDAWLQTHGAKVWLQTEAGEAWLQTWGGEIWLHTESGRGWLEMQSKLKQLEISGGGGLVQSQSKRELLETRRGQEWLQTWNGRHWLQSSSGREWLESMSGREWLWTESGQGWLETEGQGWLQVLSGRDWLQTKSGRGWLQTPGGRDWLQTPSGQDWLWTSSGQDWLRTSSGQEWFQTKSGREWQRWLWIGSGRRLPWTWTWLESMGGREWLESMDGREWLESMGGREWLESMGGREWLESMGGREWLETISGREWLECMGGRQWLETISGRQWLKKRDEKIWLQTRSGQDWLQSSDGQDWLRTSSGQDHQQTSSRQDWLQTSSGQEWLQTLSGQTFLRAPSGQDWLQTSSGQDWLQTSSGKIFLQAPIGQDWLQTPGGGDWLQTEIGQGWLHTQSGRDWLQIPSGREWLQTPHGQNWLQTPGGQDWLQSEIARKWLQTPSGEDWLQTPSGREWVGTLSGRRWLQIDIGQDWLQTQSGREWLQTPSGQNWLQTPDGLQTPRGQEWLQTQSGREWLQSSNGQNWLQTPDGLQTPRGQEWLQTQSGQIWLQTQNARDWLQTQGGQDWLQTLRGKEWLRTLGGRDWLQTQSGRDWLQSPSGQDWLQTSHGQAWQSTPAVTLEQFFGTLEAISKYTIVIITPEQPLLPAFQVIQQFKSMPDFLMFPTFLALQHQDRSTYVFPQRRPSLNMDIIEPVESTSLSYIFPTLPSFGDQDDSISALLQSHSPPDAEIIHAMKAFMGFANQAQGRSRLASEALKYACHNWTVHLSQAPKPWNESLGRIFKSFWNRRLLSWLERQWCLKDLRSCLTILSEGEKLMKEHFPQASGSSQSGV